MFRNSLKLAAVAATLIFTSSCGGGSGGGASGEGSGGSAGANFGCDGGCENQFLTTADVSRIVQQAAEGARRLGTAGTFAVVDRTGNVLALYRMNGAPATTTINGQIGATGILEGLTVPATIAAISKAGTGAYLSSQGNAFSTRTASQIIQENFLPGQEDQPGGPLFGVQFSQLLCSDVTVINPDVSGGVSLGGKLAVGGSVGPRPLPLGLSADPGGLPLYKNGDLVGGIGVEFDGLYTLDRNVLDTDDDPEERVALTASIGFEAPAERVGDNIFLAGRTFRFADISYGNIEPLPEALEPLESGGLVSELFYSNGEIRQGAPFGDPASGIAETIRAGLPAAFLVDGSGAPRFPTREGRAMSGSLQLKPNEVDALLDSGLQTANRARAAIRTPRDTAARVSVWIIDDQGTPLGMIRAQDAPMFGIDVALQKARTAVFFSSADANDKLLQANASSGGTFSRNYAAEYTAFTSGLTLDGSFAIAARTVGNLSRPFYPDGIDGNPPGPFSLPFPGLGGGRTWSPFNTGLELDLVVGAIAAPLGIPVSPPSSIPTSCTNGSVFGSRLRNGIQIFAGGVPLYREGVLIGGIGVSGDGIDQDDMMAFLSSTRRGLDYAGHTDVGDPTLGFSAPPERRADKIPLPGTSTSLRYVNCPESPFRNSSDQNACEGL